eukprot:3107833-Heterocapsa_arctica.AAC.1
MLGLRDVGVHHATARDGLAFALDVPEHHICVVQVFVQASQGRVDLVLCEDDGLDEQVDVDAVAEHE